MMRAGVAESERGVSKAVGMTSLKPDLDVALVKALEAFYSKYQPSKVENVSEIASRYAGDRIVELWAALGSRYDVEPREAVSWLTGTMHKSSAIQMTPGNDGSTPPDRLQDALRLAAQQDDPSVLAGQIEKYLEAGDVDVASAVVFRCGCPDAGLRPKLWLAMVDCMPGEPIRQREARETEYKRICELVAAACDSEDVYGVHPADSSMKMATIKTEVAADVRVSWASEHNFFQSTDVLQAATTLALCLAQTCSHYIKGSCEMALLLLFALSCGEPCRVSGIEGEAFWCLVRILQVYMGGDDLGSSLANCSRKARVNRVARLLGSYDSELTHFLTKHALLEPALLRLGAALCTRGCFSLDVCLQLWDCFLADPRRFEFHDHIIVALLLQHRDSLMQCGQGLLLDTLLSGGSSANRLRDMIFSLPEQVTRGQSLAKLLNTATSICAFERWCSASSRTPYPPRTKALESYLVVPSEGESPMAARKSTAMESIDSAIGDAKEQLTQLWDRLWLPAADPQTKLQASPVLEESSPTTLEPMDFGDLVLRTPLSAKPLLTIEMARCVQEHLPLRFRLSSSIMEWSMCYSPKAHGISMATMYRNLANVRGTLLFVQDDEDHIFGGFAPNAWEPSGKFYGSGEAFVFTFGNTALTSNPEVAVYPWTSQNTWCMYADMQVLAMGGGEGRHAVAVESSFLHGFSAPTPTFGNPILASKEEFIVRDVEVWSLDEVD
mmetsp:Transcript_28733/g.66696  ORF Transcript_28733/g.66696 Transcript_28733/m.66696 type:complete len:724 (-) Transcript_28733:111-2282(-)